MSVPVMAVGRFERFFRKAPSLDVFKDDLKRYCDFVGEVIHDLLLRGEAIARANGREIIEPHDLPITKGLQESMHQFRRIDEDVELKPILEHLATSPQLDMEYTEETQAQLPAIVGGLSVAQAMTLKVIDPGRRKPHSEDWERVFRIFDLLL